MLDITSLLLSCFIFCAVHLPSRCFLFLQIRSTLVGDGLPRPAMMMFNRTIRALLPQTGREPIKINNKDEYYKALKQSKKHILRIMILTRTLHFFCRIYSISPVGRQGPWMHGVIIEVNSDGH